jgi:hypothetical protein
MIGRKPHGIVLCGPFCRRQQGTPAGGAFYLF